MKWLFLIFLLIGSCIVNAQNTLPKSKHAFVVIAHRGDHTEAPENTLQAYKNAIKNNVDYIEIDLRTTKDSQLVIMHDENLLRMTGVNEKVSNLTLDALKQLRVREKSHPDWGEHTIPTFSEVLKLAKGRVNIYLDFKNASVEKAYQEILQNHMKRSFIVYNNSPLQFKQWRMVAPDAPLMVSLPNDAKTAEGLTKFIENYHPDLLDGGFEDYTDDLLKIAKQNRINVWPDIQSFDEEKNWERAVKLNFTGLQTDHPRALIQFLQSKKLR
jgi:glycerophosphoryl diester phosphodiesterase